MYRADFYLCNLRRDILRRDRNRNGGGVSMYIRKNIPYSNREDLAVENIELICFEVKKNLKVNHC